MENSHYDSIHNKSFVSGTIYQFSDNDNTDNSDNDNSDNSDNDKSDNDNFLKNNKKKFKNFVCGFFYSIINRYIVRYMHCTRQGMIKFPLWL